MDSKIRRQAAAPAVGESSFDAYYFEHCCGRPYRRDDHWLAFFGAIAEHISTAMQPRRVLDAGCALGLLVEALRLRGMDAEGIDLSTYAIENTHESVRPFCRQGSIAVEFPDRYDLIVSIEVLEHMPARDGEAAIANFCRHADDVLFSSTPGDFREPSHVNVQPPEYWAELFARHGFYRDIDFDASFVTPWAARFRLSSEGLPRVVRHYERRFWALTTERNQTRAFSADVQRDLALALERAGALERERGAHLGTLDSGRLAAEAEAAALGQALADEKAARLEAETKAAASAGALGREAAAREEAETEAGAAKDELGRMSAAHRELEAEVESLRDTHIEMLVLRSTQAELFSLRAALDETHRHLNRKVAALDASEERAAALHAAVAVAERERDHSRATIRNMEHSVFWRIRGIWARLSRLAGRPT